MWALELALSCRKQRELREQRNRLRVVTKNPIVCPFVVCVRSRFSTALRLQQNAELQQSIPKLGAEIGF